MSQKVSRKTAVNEDKEKRSSDSPVKEMKKKMAANAEKEKQAAEKTDNSEKPSDKSAEKATEKSDKPEKPEKSADKKSDKKENVEKKDHAEKKSDKPEPQAEKSKEETSKDDKSGKSEKEKPETKKAEPSKQKQNGRDRVHNGVSDVTLGNGTDDVLNGTVSADSEDDDVMLVIDDHDHDELFPELTYDDTSDVECFEPPTPENVPSRSLTRRSQVKATRTPETPRPASDKQTDKDPDDPKDSKVLKLKDDAQAPATDRKLRSADSPKPQEVKKQDTDKKQDTGKKDKDEKKQEKDGQDKEESKDVVGDKNIDESKSQDVTVDMEVIEVEGNDGSEAPRKTDTNFSKSRVKVSPYRRSGRRADHTNTSVIANYTGNNTTMEMDITETSSIMEENLDDSSYLRGLRSIRGRSSYKPLNEITLRHTTARTVRSNTSLNAASPATEPSRPTGTVVGRKRKPDTDDSVEVAADVGAELGAARACGANHKRMRVLDRLTEPFRRVAAVSLPAAHRRNAEIVGINTDLPLTAPVVSTDTFDPESLKSTALPAPPPPPHDAPLAEPLAPRAAADNKRCAVM